VSGGLEQWPEIHITDYTRLAIAPDSGAVKFATARREWVRHSQV